MAYKAKAKDTEKDDAKEQSYAKSGKVKVVDLTDDGKGYTLVESIDLTAQAKKRNHYHSPSKD
jgi:hypothetical protein